MSENKKDKVTEIVTKKIIESLEKAIASGSGVAPWKRPWKASYVNRNGHIGRGPCNAISGRPYHGINSIILQSCAFAGEPWFLTAKQVTELKCRIKAEEWKNSVPILFWGSKEEEKEDDKGNIVKKRRYFKYFHTVYHWTQIEGNCKKNKELLPVWKKLQKALAEAEKEKGTTPAPVVSELEQILKAAEQEKKIAAVFYDEEGRAYYRPSADEIHLPEVSGFASVNAYLETFAHEAIHSTGHQSRLNRKEVVETAGFGSEIYSREELTAEIGAGILCGQYGIDCTDNAVSYCASWLKVLKNDTSFLVSAASSAKKAVEYIIGSEESGTEE